MIQKNRIRPVKVDNGVRMSYSRQKEVLEMPNLIEVQKESYEWFLNEGLREVFRDIFPIEDYSGKLSLDFVEYKLCRDDVKYSIEECKERDATYAAPLKVKVRFHNKKDDESVVKDHEIFMGDFPLMTDTGTFVINGAERVIVSQLVRSPGIYYGTTKDKTGKNLYTCQVIPSRGAWLEYETTSADVFSVKVDRNKKVPITIFLRALGIGTKQQIIDMFGDELILEASFAKEPADVIEADSYEAGIKELYKKLRPGEPVSVESAESLVRSDFFDMRRYDLAKVGRYKYNKKLTLRSRVVDCILSEDVLDSDTGEIIAEAGTKITGELADKIQNAGVFSITVKAEDHDVKVISNMAVDLACHVPFKCDDKVKAELGIKELVYYPALKELLEQYGDNEDELKDAIKRNTIQLIPKHITKEDIFATISYMIHVSYNIGTTDDIDHLGNRRIRSVGELLQNQYRIGLSRMERVVRERMRTSDLDNVSPQNLINIKPVTAAVKEFFGSSQLSQFMDQHNPLGELAHKRRLSALGPGGLSRDRASFEVRDVHYSHYGRMCPVETPEGPNIGLINSLASYARINEYGFIEAPYRRIDKSDPLNPRVTDDVVYVTADVEDKYIVAQANTPLDEEGHFINNVVSGRHKDEISQFQKTTVDLMDVSPKMVFSIATALIPFLENDDANRALMGSNMQRQAVPLLNPQAPAVGTGMEHKTAIDAGVCVIAKNDGKVEKATSTQIVVRKDDGTRDEYKLIKFTRSNQGTCINQKPIVNKGDMVKAGEIIADGPSTFMGELALGSNPLIGFMTWEGYNYEDAVLLSERLVAEDVYTSVHIEKYEVEARDTKLGPEQITRDISGVGDEALKDLDERGIIHIGAEVRAGDILVGRVTPKGEADLTPEEKLLRAIFGEKAREVRDTSLRVPHGEYGIIVDTKVFTRENGDELPPGVNETVRVYIAQKRKIQVGDKMAGRHGNKGVVSRVLPVEDMPFLPNGRPLDIVLNPLGVPSRMNIGQVLEIHLSLAAKVLGFNIATPVFDGASEKDIQDTLEMANDYANLPFDAEEKQSWADKAAENGTDFDENMPDFSSKYAKLLGKEVMGYLGSESNLASRDDWRGVPIRPDGKVKLRDGRSGEFFDGEVTIGFMHYLKLHHLVDDKIHARSIGPYSLVTQQPLGGKAQFGGQRFGEMEVWALEAYGAAHVLQEILTVKSDDVNGRIRTYEAIVKGENISRPGLPESFKVLIKELQALALDVTVRDENGDEIKLAEDVNENEKVGSVFREGTDEDYDSRSRYGDDEGYVDGYSLKGQSDLESEAYDSEHAFDDSFDFGDGYPSFEDSSEEDE